MHWFTKQTTRVCTSSSEAECYGLCEMGKENQWQRDLQVELGLFELEGPTPTWEDNTAAITLSGSNTYHARSKHFGLDWYSTKERVERKEMVPMYISTEEQVADYLTKTDLTVAKFQRFRDAMMGAPDLQDHFGRLSPPTAKEVVGAT